MKINTYTTLIAALFLSGITLAAKIEPQQPTLTVYGSTQSIGDVDFRSVRLAEVARLVSKLSGFNVIASNKVADMEVTLYLRNTTLPALVSNLCRATGLWYRFDRDSRTYIIMSEDEFRHDIIVARDDKTRVLTLKHNNVVSAANAVKSLFGDRVQLEIPVEEAPPLALSSRNAGQISVAANNLASISGQGGLGYNRFNPYNDGRYYDGRPNNNYYNTNDDPNQLRSIKQIIAEASTNTLKELQATDGKTKVNPSGAPIYVTYNNLHNLLMVRSSDEDALNAIDQLIASIDLPSKQVLLEMQILELGVGDDFKSAFSVSYSDGKSSIGFGNDAKSAGGGFSYGFLNDMWKIRLELLQSQNKIKVVSTPSLLSINNQPARLFIGEEAILTTGIDANTTTNDNQTNTKTSVKTEKRDIGQTLTILPRINADRSIALTIDQEISNIIRGGATLPITLDNRVVNWPIDTVSNATSQLTVLAQDGRAIIIGGLTKSSISRNADKVPVLGDVPVVGHLFRSTNDTSSERQMVLIITPRLMDAGNYDNFRTANMIANKTSEVMYQTPVGNMPDLNNVTAPFKPAGVMPPPSTSDGAPIVRVMQPPVVTQEATLPVQASAPTYIAPKPVVQQAAPQPITPVPSSTVVTPQTPIATTPVSTTPIVQAPISVKTPVTTVQTPTQPTVERPVFSTFDTE
ncbi:hypothetical protein [Chitinibacter sp. S2-10]|uniref:hypothetical protein n=1 Tax=Chitinibacter sp. S2-10 TaxID=3373597 RepID=UPI003977CD17